MNQPSLERRVEILEQKVDNLASLPERVASLENQFVQLGDEMRVGFSALHASDEETRKEMRALNEQTRGEFACRLEDLKAHMLALHEDVIERIKWLGERFNGGHPSSS